MHRIEAIVYQSRDFWEDFDAAEYQNIYLDYTNKYNELIKYYTNVLGTPVFSGNYFDEAYPENEAANYLTYWELPTARFQLEFTHPDKEFPLFIQLVCYKI